jgi:hypothetical protein
MSPRTMTFPYPASVMPDKIWKTDGGGAASFGQSFSSFTPFSAIASSRMARRLLRTCVRPPEPPAISRRSACRAHIADRLDRARPAVRIHHPAPLDAYGYWTNVAVMTRGRTSGRRGSTRAAAVSGRNKATKWSAPARSETPNKEHTILIRQKGYHDDANYKKVAGALMRLLGADLVKELCRELKVTVSAGGKKRTRTAATRRT